MTPQGQTLILDKVGEMNALEMGMRLTGTDPGHLPRGIDGRRLDSPSDDVMYGYDPLIGQVSYKNIEAIVITPNNLGVAIKSLEAVVALGGVSGFCAAVVGRKETARSIIQYFEDRDEF